MDSSLAHLDSLLASAAISCVGVRVKANSGVPVVRSQDDAFSAQTACSAQVRRGEGGPSASTALAVACRVASSQIPVLRHTHPMISGSDDEYATRAEASK